MTEPSLFDAVKIVDRFASGESVANIAISENLHLLAVESIIRLALKPDYGTDWEDA